MADITIGPGFATRFYKLSVATDPVGIASTHLISHSGKQIERAVGIVLGGSVRMGVLGILSPSAATGLPFAVSDVIRLEGADNVKSALFVQNSGAATIDWLFFSDTK